MMEMALYRVVQKALANVAKHARATHVRVRVQKTPQAVQCSILDDGIGFDVSAVLDRKGERGLGLIGIRERLNTLGGTLSITSDLGRGTELLVTVPLEV